MPLLFMKEDETKRHVYSFEGTEDFRLPRVLPQENKVGAEYTLNLRLKTDFSQASQTDDLNYTINYAEVFKAVKEEMKIPSAVGACHPAYCRTIVSRFPANHRNQDCPVQAESSYGSGMSGNRSRIYLHQRLTQYEKDCHF